MEKARSQYNRLEKNLEQEDNHSEEDLKRWKKEWKKFHKSLPNKVVFENGFILYKHEDNIYMPYQSQRKRWYCPF